MTALSPEPVGVERGTFRAKLMRVCTQNRCDLIGRLTLRIRGEVEALDRKSQGSDDRRKPSKPNGLAQQDRTLTAGRVMGAEGGETMRIPIKFCRGF